jgi:hypothetical protein
MNAASYASPVLGGKGRVTLVTAEIAEYAKENLTLAHSAH